MAINIVKIAVPEKKESAIDCRPFNTKERRQLYLADMAKVGSSCGSAFTSDNDMERFYQVWVQKGRPANTWVGYTIKDKELFIDCVGLNGKDYCN